MTSVFCPLSYQSPATLRQPLGQTTKDRRQMVSSHPLSSVFCPLSYQSPGQYMEMVCHNTPADKFDAGECSGSSHSFHKLVSLVGLEEVDPVGYPTDYMVVCPVGLVAHADILPVPVSWLKPNSKKKVRPGASVNFTILYFLSRLCQLRRLAKLARPFAAASRLSRFAPSGNPIASRRAHPATAPPYAPRG